MSKYSIKVPFKAVPQGDAALRLEQQLLRIQQRWKAPDTGRHRPGNAAKAGNRRGGLQVCAEKPQLHSELPMGRMWSIRPPIAVYVGGQCHEICNRRQRVFHRARRHGKSAWRGGFGRRMQAVQDLGKVKRAGMGVALTRTGAIAAYWRLITSDAVDTRERHQWYPAA